MKNYNQRIFTLFLERGVLILLALVVNKLIAVGFDIELMGSAAIVISVATVGFSLSTFGIPNVTLKLLSTEKHSKNLGLVIQGILLQVFVSILLIIPVAIFLRNLYLILWCIAFIFFMIIDKNIEIFLINVYFIKRNAFANIVARIIKLVTIILMFMGFVKISLIFYLLTWLLEIFVKVTIKGIYIYYARSEFRYIFNWDNTASRQMFQQGKNMIIVSFNESLIEYSDIYSLKFIKGDLLVGFYDRIYQLFKK